MGCLQIQMWSAWCPQPEKQRSSGTMYHFQEMSREIWMLNLQNALYSIKETWTEHSIKVKLLST